MDFWIPLLGSALGGAVITSIFGFVKHHQDKATEHAQWLRNQKIDVYTNLLRQSHVSLHNIRAAENGLRPQKKALKDITDITNARLMVVGSREVRSRAIIHIDNLARAFQAVGTERYGQAIEAANTAGMYLEESIREDLDVVEKQAVKHTVRAWFYRYLVYPWRDPWERRYHRKNGHAWVDRKGLRR